MNYNLVYLLIGLFVGLFIFFICLHYFQLLTGYNYDKKRAEYLNIRVPGLNKFYHFLYRFNLPQSSQGNNIQKALEFWQSRKFECQIVGNKLIGTRGSEKQNVTAMDTLRKFCSIDIDFHEDSIQTTLEYKGVFQVMHPLSEMGHKLELVAFEKYLTGQSIQGVLDAHTKEKFRGFFGYVMSGGKSLPEPSPELKEMFNKIGSNESLQIKEVPSPYPTIENNIQVDVQKKSLLNSKALILWVLLVFVMSFLMRIYDIHLF